MLSVPWLNTILVWIEIRNVVKLEDDQRQISTVKYNYY